MSRLRNERAQMRTPARIAWGIDIGNVPTGDINRSLVRKQTTADNLEGTQAHEFTPADRKDIPRVPELLGALPHALVPAVPAVD